MKDMISMRPGQRVVSDDSLTQERKKDRFEELQSKGSRRKLIQHYSLREKRFKML
jgi:hypothetical protein